MPIDSKLQQASCPTALTPYSEIKHSVHSLSLCHRMWENNHCSRSWAAFNRSACVYLSKKQHQDTSWLLLVFTVVNWRLLIGMLQQHQDTSGLLLVFTVVNWRLLKGMLQQYQDRTGLLLTESFLKGMLLCHPANSQPVTSSSSYTIRLHPISIARFCLCWKWSMISNI